MSEVRRIVPNSQVVMVPEAETLIADALRIIQNQLTQIATLSNKAIAKGQTLPLADARVLQGYIKALVELSKESRERSKADDLSNLSDEELAKLAQQMLDKKAEQKPSK